MPPCISPLWTKTGVLQKLPANGLHISLVTYIPIKLCKTSGSIHLYKLMGSINRENITLHRNLIWDVMEIDW